MKTSKVSEHLASMPSDEELICVWFARDDFPIGVDDDGNYENLTTEEWNDVVSTFETTKWDNPLSSSWSDVHQDIYKLVGEKTHAYA